MSQAIIECGSPYNLTATGLIAGANSAGRTQTLIGWYVNSTTSGTIALKTGGSGGTALGGTITPAIGFHRYPATGVSGLYATIGGTLDVTFFIVDGQ